MTAPADCSDPARKPRRHPMAGVLPQAGGHLSQSFVHIRLGRAGAAVPHVDTSLGKGAERRQDDERDDAGRGSAGGRHVA